MGEPKPEEPKEDKTTPTFKQKKPSKGSGLTISTSDGTNSGATISTYSGGESGKKDTSQVYKDPNTGSTIATGQAWDNISKGEDYQVVASTDSKEKGTGVATPTIKERPNLTGATNSGMAFDEKAPSIQTGQIMEMKQPLVHEYSSTAGPKPFVKKKPEADTAMMDKANQINLGPRPSKDLITGEDLKYSGPESTTAINKVNPSLRRVLLSLGAGASDTLRRVASLKRR